MGQDLANFIPEIWSTKLSTILDKKGVMMQCVNRNYEGEIKNAGDSVKIRTFGDITAKNYAGSINYEDLTSPVQTMTINQKKYFAFKVDDVSKAQSNIDIMNGYLSRAKISIDLAKDAYLLSKYTDVPAANQISGSSLTKDTIYGKFVEVAKALKNANATGNGQNPWIVVNPTIEALLIQAPEFIHATAVGDTTLKEGSIGRIAGLDVRVCTNLVAVSGTTYCLAGTNDAITFASQVTETESLRLQNSFDTAIRGLYVYDAKVIVPNALAYLAVT
jgi:hypothetical protein